MSFFDNLTNAYADAVYRKDQHAFLALYAADVIVFDTWEQWFHEGRQAWADVVKNWFTGLGDDHVKVDFSPIASSMEGDGAFFCASVRYAALDGEGKELRAMENRLSWSLKRGDDGWRGGNGGGQDCGDTVDFSCWYYCHCW